MTPRVLIAVAALGLGCRPTLEAPPGTMVVVKELQASWIRNFNPFAVGGSNRWPTNCGVYEPLLIYNSVTGEYVPWLATAWAWEDDGRAVAFRIRDGVRWSDGRPLTPDDVAFTFRLLLKHAALDTADLASRIASVTVRDGHTVVISLSEPFVPGLAHIAHQSIVPEHIWGSLTDPVTFANPDPVGSGPFTEVRRFETQVYELGRNPHYWQPDAARGIDALRLPALPSNEQANLALIHGEIDWTGTFIPAVDRVFVGRDPAHHQYWFPLVGSTIFLYANTTKAPFDDVNVRKALSQAIDRDLVVKIAMHGTTRPADVTGLSDKHAGWRDDARAAAGDWVDFDPVEAGRLLDQAGWRMGDDGLRHDAAGDTLTAELQVVSGWSDWVRAAQIMNQQLRAVGIDSDVRSRDFGAWMESLSRGDFTLSLGWAGDGPTPYDLYQSVMGPKGLKPVGEAATVNWHRFGDARAGALLETLERDPDPAVQRATVTALQARFDELAPAIPLFPSPSWGQANTTRFTGFPSADDPYALLSPHKAPEALLVLTHLQARDDVAVATPRQP